MAALLVHNSNSLEIRSLEVAVKLSRRVVRFAIVGSLCFLVQYGLMFALVYILPLYFAEGTAFLISAQLNFVLSLTFTWGDRTSDETLVNRWLKYNASALLSAFVVNGTTFWSLVALGTWQWAAMLCANAASMLFTFAMNNFFVFGDNPVPTSSKEKPLLPHVESVAYFMPAHNEADNLQDVVKRAHKFFDNAGIDERTIIVVDDGSTDNTQDVITDIKPDFPVTIVKHEVNMGYGCALRSGFQAALDTGHKWIAFSDSDGQFNPTDLDLLFDAVEQNGTSVALGVRANRADNMKRRVAGRMWHHLSQAILKFEAQDVDCGFKLFHRDALHKVVPSLRCNHACISPELLARLHHAGYNFAEVAVPHHPRNYGEQSGLKLRVIMGSVADLLSVRQDIVSKEFA